MNLNSKELFINIKEKDIPYWNDLYPYDEQDDDVKQFWENEAIKLSEGITINGVFIHPWLYWHINFWHMMLDKGDRRVPGLSQLRDNEWFFSEVLQQAERENKGVFLFGTRRFGKALLNSEILYLEDREKQIGDILVGDYIYDDSGNLVEVDGVYPQGSVMTYKVVFEDGRNVICCGEHIWRVKIGHKWIDRNLKGIMMGDYTKMYIPISKPVNYPARKLPIQPSAFGAMLSSFLCGSISEIPFDKKLCKNFLRSSIDQKKIFIESFIRAYRNVVTGEEVINITNKDIEVIRFIQKMFWSYGWYANYKDGKLILSNNRKELRIKSISMYGKYPATCITVNNSNHLFLTTNYVVTHNSAIMSSFVARNATMTYNLTHNVIGSSKEDLMNIGEYMEYGLDNIHPFLKINRTGNDWFKEVILGTKNVRNERDVHARIRITNIDQGRPSAALKPAGGTPYTTIYDEVGKYPFLAPYEAGLPSHMQNGRIRGYIFAMGCCCAGTIVYKANGEPCKIEDLKQEDGILGYDIKEKKISAEKITWMKPPAKKPCYRITTRRGVVLECSEDHPILTQIMRREGNKRFPGCDFRRADSLKKGRHICFPENVDIWGNNKMFDPYLIGLLIGDGSYGFDKTPVLATCDEEVFEYVNSRYECVIERSYITSNDKIYREIRIKGICGKLREIGIYGQTRNNKRLPLNINSYSREDIIMMIRGYFDADSCCVCKSNTPNRVNLDCSCYDLLKEVEMLLCKFGIYGIIRKVKNTNPNDRSIKKDGYVLSISNSYSLNNFINIINSDIKYKKDILSNVLNKISLGKKMHYKSKYLEGIVLDTIKKIEFIGEKDVYNLTASNTHTYLANNIITHNTGGNVEKSQDAQKVMNDPERYSFMVFDYDILNKKCIKPTWRISAKTACFAPGQMSHAFEKDKTTLDKYLNIEKAPGLKKIPISVTNFERSTESIDKKLESLAKGDKSSYVQYKMAYPKSVDDCFLNANVNRFPVEDALIHKSRLLEEGRPGKLVDIYQIENKKIGYRFSEKVLAPYPFQGGNIDAPVVIYEDPPEEGGLFDYTYTSGLDPYKQDKSGTSSLGALYILKRHVRINDPFAYRIVASVVSRPPKIDDFCRTCEILIEAYGAKCLMENADTMFQTYLSRRNKQFVLLEEGEAVANKLVNNKARQNNKLGLAPTVPNQRVLYNLVIQYCWEDITIGYDDDGNEIKQKGIYRIPDIELLDEIIAFGPGVNTDRIIAFAHALALAQYYDDMNYMPKSTTEKMNEEKREKIRRYQVRGFTTVRHNPFKIRRLK